MNITNLKSTKTNIMMRTMILMRITKMSITKMR